MDDEDGVLETVARQIADAIMAPLKPPSPDAVERYRQELIERVRQDSDVVSAEADPNDPLGVIVVAKDRRLVRRINLTLLGDSHDT